MKDFLDHINKLDLNLNLLNLIKENNECILSINKKIVMQYFCNKDVISTDFSLEKELSYGKCILSGLGMGILTNFLLKNEKIKKVIVFEINNDVIKLYKMLNVENSKLKIINKDIHDVSNEECDCLFLDHYEDENFFYILNSIKKINKNIKSKVFWFWDASRIIFQNNDKNLSNYKKFIEENTLKNMPDLNEETLKKFIY